MCFFYNSRDRTWQPLLVSSQPILDFLEPLVCTVSVLGQDEGYTEKYNPLPEGVPEGAHLHTCTPAPLHTCAPAHLHTCIPEHLHTGTPAHLPSGVAEVR